MIASMVWDWTDNSSQTPLSVVPNNTKIHVYCDNVYTYKITAYTCHTPTDQPLLCNRCTCTPGHREHQEVTTPDKHDQLRRTPERQDERRRHRLPCCGFPHRDADSIYTRMRIVTVDPNSLSFL
ncbi:uncharacterized protein LOC144619300 [Crassostrea virginica]